MGNAFDKKWQMVEWSCSRRSTQGSELLSCLEQVNLEAFAQECQKFTKRQAKARRVAAGVVAYLWCLRQLSSGKTRNEKGGFCFQERGKRAHKYRYMGVEDCFIESTDNPFSEQPISQMKIVKDLLGTMSRTWKATKYREMKSTSIQMKQLGTHIQSNHESGFHFNTKKNAGFHMDGKSKIKKS
jgi:hypothetical protein